VILAAGMGLRLRPAVPDVPKGLLTLGGRPIVGRSLRLLRDAGVERIVIVAGYRAEQYVAYAAGEPDVSVAVNERFAESGSMASLAVALARSDLAREPLLIVESDLVYESRALTALLDAPGDDATLLSGPTGAGDEVWVWAPEGRLVAMSKRVHGLPGVTGEFVGLTRISAATAAAMVAAFEALARARGDDRVDYETDALVAVAGTRPIAAVLVPDLLWGEIDDERQLERVRRQVWPALQ
jgi:2-aminoethylphosphonate-pyruvate transaminase